MIDITNYTSIEIDELIWQSLRAIYLNPVREDEFILKLLNGTVETNYLFTLWADCCSESYVSDIIKNISLPYYPYFWQWFIINWIQELELKDWEAPPRESRQDVDSIYGIKIYLKCEWDDDNCITIIYRNSSNWYYGGSHSVFKLSDEEFKNAVNDNFKLITKDYSSPF